MLIPDRNRFATCLKEKARHALPRKIAQKLAQMYHFNVFYISIPRHNFNRDRQLQSAIIPQREGVNSVAFF